MDTEKLALARGFLDNARDIQRKSGKLCGGHLFLSTEVQEAIHSTLQELSLNASELNIDASSATKLLEWFEEMCRRRQIQSTKEIRKEIYQILLFELYVNKQILEVDEKKLVSVTMHEPEVAGAILSEEEFVGLVETPGIVRNAAVHNPSDPRAFLRKVHIPNP